MLGQLESGSKPSPRVYTELISLYKSPNALKGEFSTCFTELQRDFALSRPTKLKDLIRLVKYWYKQVGQLPFQPSGYCFYPSSAATGKPALTECSVCPLSPTLEASPRLGDRPIFSFEDLFAVPVTNPVRLGRM